MDKCFRVKKKPFKHSTSFYRKVKFYLNKPLEAATKRKACMILEPMNTLQDKQYPLSTNFNSSVNEQNIPCLGNKNVSSEQYEVNFTQEEQPNVFFETFVDSSEELESKLNENSNDESHCYFVENFRSWALKHSITHCAINEVLKLLTHHGIKNLPKDSRTILKTPREVSINQMGKGEYWHNGLKSCLLNILEQIDILPDCVSLTFNMDGLPVYRSSKCELWPILCLIDNIPDLQPMIVGIYCGQSKPENAKIFLTPFVRELKALLQNGIKVGDLLVDIKIKCFVCDTPARSFVKGTVSSNHYHGCTKCVAIGEYYNDGRHMSFPRIHLPVRTDVSFRGRIDADHHKETSPLEELPIDFIKDFPVADSLHLIDLGITKRCLIGWTHGSFNFRTKWSARQIEEISGLLESYNSFKPRELHRAIRKLDCLRFWKGLEFRTFLLYVGPVVLKDFLPTDVYHHFLSLSCAITICSCKTYLPFLNVAEGILEDYIENFIIFYGIDSVSSNVHNLCHLIEDVKNLGYLPSISAYPFESLLYKIKNLLRTGNRPLAQVAKRLNEFAHINLKRKTNNGWPLTKKESKTNYHDLPICDRIFYELHLNDGFVLTNENNDKWFMTNKNEIVAMINVTYVGKNLYIYGTDIKDKYCFFERPFNSSRINIFESSGETNSPKLYSIKEIKCKLFALPRGKSIVFTPIIHTLDIDY